MVTAHSNLAGSPGRAVAQVAKSKLGAVERPWSRAVARELDGAVEIRPDRTKPLVGNALLAVAIALVALNLRPAVTSISSVLDAIHASLGVSVTWSSTLTALPSLCFAGASAVAPWLNTRLGIGRAVGLSMLLLSVGAVVRVLDGPTVIMLGTFLAAAGIAVGNVLLPVVVKESFPLRLGLLTGIYTAMLQGGGAIGAGLTPALMPLFDGWRGALLAWGGLAAVALVLWVLAARHQSAPMTSPDVAGTPEPEPVGSGRSVLRSAVAWQVTILFGMQSLTAYAVMGWLPQVFIDHGLPRQTAGLLLGLVAVIAVPLSLIVPPMAARLPNQGPWVIGMGVVGMLGIGGLIVAPAAAPVLWSVLLGTGMSVFSLVLTLISLRTRSSADTARLSAMAQSIGYLISAAGPFLFGLLHSLTGDWTASFVLLLGTMAVQLVFGWLAGRPRYV